MQNQDNAHSYATEKSLKSLFHYLFIYLFIYFNEASQVTEDMEGFVSRVPTPMFDQIRIKLEVKLKIKMRNVYKTHLPKVVSFITFLVYHLFTFYDF